MATARKLPSGNYRCLVFVGKSDDCKSGYKSFTAPTKKEAEKMAASFEEEIKTDQEMTVGKIIDLYIESKSNILSPSTIFGYNQIRNNCLKSIIDKPVKSLTDNIVQNAFNQDATRLSPKSMRNTYGLFSASIKMIHAKPFYVTLPQKEKKEREIPTTQQVEKLLQESTGDLHLAILLASQLGLSRSEIAALTMEDCKDGVIRVNKAIVPNKDFEWVEKVPKEYARYRNLSVTADIQEELSLLKKGPKEKIIDLNPGVIGQRFSKLCKKLFDKNFGFHALRHYNVSVMLSLNIHQ